MRIGAPKTKKSLIGTFELRVGPLSKAGNLTSDHSVGIVDQVKLDITFDTVDLMAGFPQKPVDTAVTKYMSGFTATLKENSRRNLNLLLGNSYADYDTSGSDVSGVVNTTSAITGGAVSIPMALSFNEVLTKGDTVVIYDTDNPSNVSICVVSSLTAATSTVGAAVALSSSTPIVGAGFSAGASVKLYKSALVSGGSGNGVPNYYSAQLLRIDRGTGRPVGFDFWKTSIVSGLSLSSSITDFASMDMQLKAFEPLAIEYASGGSLSQLVDIIPTYPVFRVFDVSDAA